MMEKDIRTIGRCAIVIRGSFNPGILHPDWFDRFKLLPAEETAALTDKPQRIEIPEIGGTLEYGKKFLVEPTRASISFKTFKLKCERDRLEIFCEERIKFPLLIEFVKKFFMMLSHTPVNAYGINFVEHIKSSENVTQILEKFFSKSRDFDKFFGDESKFGCKIYTHIGDKIRKCVIEPSFVLDGAVYYEISYHYDINPPDAETLLEQFESHFEEDLADAERIIGFSCGTVAERLEYIEAQLSEKGAENNNE